MYKLKDGVDLQMLKKFGYEYEPATDGYYKVYFPKLLRLIPLTRDNRVRGLAIYNDRNITIKRRYGFAWIPAYDDLFAIKDLVNAGLVEGVS